MKFYKNGKVYVCKYKLLGFPFATLDKEDAEKWVGEDSESRYFQEIDLMISELSIPEKPIDLIKNMLKPE